MSLTLITNPPTSLTVDTDWTTFVAREGVSQIGTGLSIPIFRLTNWDSGTSRPLVEIGSIIEVGGSLYQADSDTDIVDDASIVDGLCFIKLVPDVLTVIPTLTNDTPPAFNAEKAGWYDGDEKWLPFVLTRAGSGSSFVSKGEYVDQNKNVIRYIDGGTYMSGATQVGGALTVGAGATFNGAVSGITNLTASGNGSFSGNLSFSSKYTVKHQQLVFSTDTSGFEVFYTATKNAFVVAMYNDHTTTTSSVAGNSSFVLHASGATGYADVGLVQIFNSSSGNLTAKANKNELLFSYSAGGATVTIDLMIFDGE